MLSTTHICTLSKLSPELGIVIRFMIDCLRTFNCLLPYHVQTGLVALLQNSVYTETSDKGHAHSRSKRRQTSQERTIEVFE